MNAYDFVGNELRSIKFNVERFCVNPVLGGVRAFEYVVSERWLRGMKSVGENEA